MPVSFRSLRSGSSGNCLMLWSNKTRILFDCGFRTQRGCRASLKEDACVDEGLDAVIVSHTHGDHIHTSSLHVLAENEIPVIAHEDSVGEIHRKHLVGRKLVPEITSFGSAPLRVGDFEITAFGVPHWNTMDTFGFSVSFTHRKKPHKVVIATDLYSYDGLLDEFLDADFIYIEANHDHEMLLRNYNPNSEYHMDNRDTGALIADVLTHSGVPPKSIMLGHLSDERNTPEKALQTVSSILAHRGITPLPPILVAPRDEPSEIVRLTV